MSTIRVVYVRHEAGQPIVTFYAGDREAELAWPGEAPSPGDVWELQSLGSAEGARRLSSAAQGGWATDGDALRWRRPIAGSGLSRMEVLKRRHLIRRAVRSYLDEAGYIEIDAPLLLRGTTPDPAVESFEVDGRYLATSTEYPMKRLVAGGFERLYSLTQNFRRGDGGRFRNPEFTMLEWGRIGIGMRAIEADVEGFTLRSMESLGLGTVLSYGGRHIDMSPPWERLSVAQAIERTTGVAVNGFELAACLRAVEASGMIVREDWAENRDFLLSLLLEHVQPRLGLERPVFVHDWPLYQTTSAAAGEDATLADRSELLIAGIEISDGFSGLTDAALQEQFFGYALHRRHEEGQLSVELDAKYLAAMRLGAPYGAGMALGFDRLVMLLTDQSEIGNVLALGWDEL